MKTFKDNVVLYYVLIVVALMLIIGGCDKDKDIPTPPPDGQGIVDFSPNLYGEAVPWLTDGKEADTKGFTEFTHKYFNHVIRIQTAANVWVADIPITQVASALYSMNLTAGTYKAGVIPILEDATTGVRQSPAVGYTALNLWSVTTPITARTFFNKAPIYTRGNVNFTVTAANKTNVTLPCVTDFACFELDLAGGTFAAAGLPAPEVWSVVSTETAFITAHSVLLSEEATFAQLQAVNSTTGRFLTASAFNTGTLMAPSTTAKLGRLEYDATANIYFGYHIPGHNTATYNVADLVGITPTYVDYFAFDLTGGTGSTSPTLWLKDYYPLASRTWLPNTTLRITFLSGGKFTVTQSDWFTTIVTGGDL